MPGASGVVSLIGARGTRSSESRPARSLLTFILAIIVGILAAVVAADLGNLKTKPLLLSLAVIVIIPIAAITRKAKPIVLIAWVVSLTYFRVIYPIESMAGFQGFYVTVADAVFLLAMALWFYDLVFARRPLIAWGPPLLRFILPFALICLVSALVAQRSDWALYEVVRLIKVPMILLYCRYNLGPKEWWICVAALGISVALQGAFAALQFRGILGHYQLETYDLEVRPNGTLGHASIMSAYMLLLIPVFLSLAGILRQKYVKAACAGVVVLGYVALALTLSRIPWLIATLEAAMVLAAFVLFRIVRLSRAIAIFSITLLAAGLALVPFYSRIMQRVTGDLDASITWRVQMIRIGFDIFERHQFLGIGLANFPLYLEGVQNVEFADSLDLAMSGILERPSTEAEPVKGFHWAWVPHNVYVLLLVETGLLGLAGFLLFILAGLWTAFRALRRAKGPPLGAAIGLTVGLCGVLAYMMSDWSLWVDPILYTFTIAISLLNNIGVTGTSAANSVLAFDQPLRLGVPVGAVNGDTG